MDEVLKRLAAIEGVVDQMRHRRIYQDDIVPDAVKQRHIGEGVRFLRYGLAAARPTSGELTGAVYFASDTTVASVWTGSAWKTIPVVAAAQTYAASNVTTDRTYDADTVAVAELADIVGTLIADLRTLGIVA